MNEYAQIIKVTEEYVSSMYDEYKAECLYFHNLDHTKQVVKRTNEIADHYQLSSRDTLVLLMAAWFHDTGYLFVSPQLHEEKSVEMMKEFAAKINIGQAEIDDIAACIMVTKIPRTPTNMLQKIICDADTYHLGTKDFRKYNKSIRKEFSCTAGEAFSLAGFNDNALKFFHEHRFYTDYCVELLNEQKKENMKKLLKKIKTDEVMAGLDDKEEHPGQIVE